MAWRFLLIITVCFFCGRMTIYSKSPRTRNWYFKSVPCFTTSKGSWKEIVSNPQLIPPFKPGPFFDVPSLTDCLTRMIQLDTTSSNAPIIASYRTKNDNSSSWRCHNLVPASGNGSGLSSIEDVMKETCVMHFPTTSSCDSFGGHATGTMMLFLLSPQFDVQLPTVASCDLGTTGDAGWTVIQRRQDGSVTFSRGWEDYKNGFGDVLGEFWFGLENIRKLVSTQKYELRIDMTAQRDSKWYAEFDSFYIADEDDFYQLCVSGYSGDADDAFSIYDGHPFSTSDWANSNSSMNCAKEQCKCGFWFVCDFFNPNGQYDLLSWKWLWSYNPVIYMEMKIRPATVTVTVKTKKAKKKSL